MPLKRGASPLALLPAYEQWAFAIATHGDDDEFWAQPGFNLERHWDRFADCPMMLLSGWYDSYTRANLENFVGLRGRKRGPVQAIMGPWTHGVRQLALSSAGDVEFGPTAPFDHNQERLAFFDRALKGEPDAGPLPLRLFVMGGGSGRRTASGRLDHGGQWREERDWPLPRTLFTEYYLHAGGRLAPDVAP